LGDSAGLGLKEVLFGHVVALLGEAFQGLGAFPRLGEPLDPLGLGGLEAWELDFGVGFWRVKSRGLSSPWDLTTCFRRLGRRV
jgi:hypothetical protein